MKQWDICRYPFEGKGAGLHYAVILSSDERAGGHSEFVNGLFSQSIRPGGHQLNEKWEVALDRADGMDWATAVRCDYFFELDRKLLERPLAEVSYHRRIVIAKMIRRLMRLDLG